jgi:hypothetical protein
MPNYILVVRGEDNDGRSLTARVVTENRFSKGLWPLNVLTRHQKDFSAGDRLLIYVAGSKDPDSHHVIADGTVRSAIIPSTRVLDNRPAWARGLTEQLFDLPVHELRWYRTPVHVPDVVRKLEFIKDPAQWGTYLQGGVKRIADHDLAIFEKHGAPSS